MTIIMGMVKMKRWHLGLRGAGFKKRVGTGDVLVMEINLTAEKNYDENYDHRYDYYDNDQHAEVQV